MSRPTYSIDGSEFETLEGFYDAVERELLGGEGWGRNLDAFNDILRGDYGPLPAEFTLEWRNSALSRQRLGYPETVRQLARKLARCHPETVPAVAWELRAALHGEGPTVFDWLAGIIREHDNVRLTLA